MRIGLVGYGSIGARHARLLRRYAKEIVVLSHRTDVPRPFVTAPDWKAFRRSGPYDVLFVTDETGKRMATVKKCLALSPRALFIEKPLALNARDAVQLLKSIRHKKISGWVGYCLQWYEPLVRAKRATESGSLGRIYSVRAFVGQDLRTWRARDYRKSYSAQAARGGGVLLDLIHEINYPAWLLGESLTPRSAFVSRESSLKINAETLAESVCTTPSGVTVHIHQDYLHSPGLRSLEVAGQNGMLRWDSITGQMEIVTSRGRRITRVRPDTDQMYIRQLTAFFRMLRSGKRFSNVEEAVQDLRVVDRIRRLAA